MLLLLGEALLALSIFIFILWWTLKDADVEAEPTPIGLPIELAKQPNHNNQLNKTEDSLKP